MSKFGTYLKELREAKGWTVRKAASMIDVSPSRLAEIERGESYRTLRETMPSRELIGRMAKAYEVSADILLELAGYQVNKAIPEISAEARLVLELFEGLSPERKDLAIQMLRVFARPAR